MWRRGKGMPWRSCPSSESPAQHDCGGPNCHELHSSAGIWASHGRCGMCGWRNVMLREVHIINMHQLAGSNRRYPYSVNCTGPGCGPNSINCGGAGCGTPSYGTPGHGNPGHSSWSNKY